jgi:hypothetical protein
MKLTVQPNLIQSQTLHDLREETILGESVRGGKNRERSGPAVRGFQKRARRRQERRTSNPPVQRAVATQIRSPRTQGSTATKE